MRNLRKLTAVVIAVALVLTSMTAAFAASGSYDFENEATVLKDLGIWQGNTAGDLMLGEDLTRAQGAVLVLKTVLGKTDKDMEAADVSTIATFDDAAEVPAWAEGWVALAVKEGVMKGGNNKLAAGDPLKGKDLASMFMNALGFAAENDYATAVAKLAAKSAGKILAGIADDITDSDLTRDAASAVVFDTLTVKAKDAAKTVVEVLVGTDAAKKAVAEKAGLIVAPAAQTVTDVKALNLVQVQITFAKEVAKADAEKKENYVVTEENSTINKAANGFANLQADGKTVILTLDQAVSNGKTAVVEVKNFTTYKSDAVKFEDTTVPSIVGVTVTGPSTITAEFSEPVRFKSDTTGVAAKTAGEFKIDNENYVVDKLAIDSTNLRKLNITVGVPFGEGAHKISFEAKGELIDFAEYKVLPRVVDFTVVKDTTAPVLTVKSADPEKVVLASNKPLLDTSITSNGNLYFRHTYNSDVYQVFGNDTTYNTTDNFDYIELNTANTEITIHFGAKKVIPLGANKLYIAYGSSTDRIKDLWGNTVEATSFDVNIQLDLVKPTVTDIKFENASQLKVIFSEEVDPVTAAVAGNYVVKDAAGKAIALKSATVTGDNKNEVLLETSEANALGGGTYTVEIKAVKDNAYIKNAMDAYSKTITINDKVSPTVKKSVMVIDASKKKATIYIPFSEAMDASTLVKANFLKSFDGNTFEALGDNDTVTVASDAKGVTIVVDKTTPDIVQGTFKIMVGIVKDAAGNGLQNYTYPVLPETDAIAVEKVEAIATKQVKVTFDGRLSAVTATGFYVVNTEGVITGGYNLSVASHTVNSDGKSEVILSLGTDLGEDAKMITEDAWLTIQGATNTKSFLGQQVTNDSKKIADKIVPTVKSVTVSGDDHTKIYVTFNEAINKNTLAATLNGFTVSGGDAELTSVAISATDAKVIELTGKNFYGDVTVVKYNSAAGITDDNLGNNKVADFEKTVTKP